MLHVMGCGHTNQKEEKNKKNKKKTKQKKGRLAGGYYLAPLMSSSSGGSNLLFVHPPCTGLESTAKLSHSWTGLLLQKKKKKLMGSHELTYRHSLSSFHSH
jgi:hypothetical protein